MKSLALKRFAAVAVSAAFVSTAMAAEVTGAGSSFVAPILSKWADAYQKTTNNKINYQSIGSGGGIKQITAKTVDFGASDMPLTPAELEKDGMIQFPTIVGGVVPVVNLSSVKPGEMRLSGAVLGDIYLGKITKWNDKAITDINPKLQLPNQDIAVVRRADGSGTSFIFTNYLSKVNAEWKAKVGEGTAVQWPLGLGGKGNEGVSAFVQRVPGAIGYVEYAYAKQNKMSYTQMQNSDGQFVQPEDDSFKAAAAGAEWTKSAFYTILTNQPGKTSWPITGATFIIMHKVQDKPAQGVEVMKFFDWGLKNGGKLATELDYVPLPDTVVKLINASLTANIRDASGKSLWPAK